nr:MAG TPA: hypothetical protein [Caudoviricetes sp.]
MHRRDEARLCVRGPRQRGGPGALRGGAGLHGV